MDSSQGEVPHACRQGGLEREKVAYFGCDTVTVPVVIQWHRCCDTVTIAVVNLINAQEVTVLDKTVCNCVWI